MRISCLLVAAAIACWLPQPVRAQDRDISRPMQVLKATLNGLVLTRLNADGIDQRLAFELRLGTELSVPASFDQMKAMPSDVLDAILKVCSDMMMPMVESADRVVGFPDISGVRITLLSKPTAVGTGTYQTLIFPQERGCKFGWSGRLPISY